MYLILIDINRYGCDTIRVEIIGAKTTIATILNLLFDIVLL
jgi:hypothetical protein|tara:strand:- start:467 stop:589 length:123 start_codon:yes stop_codon:yes gene_type:complete